MALWSAFSNRECRNPEVKNGIGLATSLCAECRHAGHLGEGESDSNRALLSLRTVTRSFVTLSRTTDLYAQEYIHYIAQDNLSPTLSKII